MNKREIVGRMASALRDMKQKPDAFVFMDGCDWTWDLPEILEVPVYYTEGLVSGFNGGIYNECRFVPLFLKEGDYNRDLKRFYEGWDNS